MTFTLVRHRWAMAGPAGKSRPRAFGLSAELEKIRHEDLTEEDWTGIWMSSVRKRVKGNFIGGGNLR